MDKNQVIQIIGVPLDLGASRRGTDGGPSVLRITGLAPGQKQVGQIIIYSVLVLKRPSVIMWRRLGEC